MALMVYCGMRVATSTWLVINGTPEAVRRSWRKRLFTHPWRPWRKTEIIVPRIPDPQVYQIGPDMILMHPVTLARLKGMLPPLEQK